MRGGYGYYHFWSNIDKNATPKNIKKPSPTNMKNNVKREQEAANIEPTTHQKSMQKNVAKKEGGSNEQTCFSAM